LPKTLLSCYNNIIAKRKDFSHTLSMKPAAESILKDCEALQRYLRASIDATD